ncbi:MAG: hypothetical protein KDB40_24695, partial [Acidimicrobiales bacterium]|nr:hypothetical protein [Acidimicrobiales bacterium]
MHTPSPRLPDPDPGRLHDERDGRDPHVTSPWPAPVDPLLRRPTATADERLARLAARRAATRPPEAPPTSRTAGSRAGGGRRPHPAG